MMSFAMLLGCALAAPDALLHAWTFNTPASLPTDGHAFTPSLADGVLRVESTSPGGGYFWMPPVSVAAPVRLQMRLRTSGGLRDRGEFYLTTKERPDVGMGRHRSFDVIHDGAWHEYDLPLPVTGTLTGVRVQFGSGTGVAELAWARLVSNAPPAAVAAAIAALPGPATLNDGTLSVTFDPAAHRYDVTDLRTGHVWTADGSGCAALVTGVKPAGRNALTVTLHDPVGWVPFTCTVSLPEPGALMFELDTPDPDTDFFTLRQYPPKLTGPAEDGHLIFNDRSAGVYAPLDDDTYAGRMLQVYGNTSCTDTPLIAVTDAARGDGFLALVETPADALFHIAPDGTGKHWPQIHWLESMDTFRYPRRFSYRFVAEGGHVALAKAYRAIAETRGLAVPLASKLEAKPGLALMPGAPIIWGSLNAWDFVREARAEGLLRAVLCNANHCLWDPASLPALNDMGYLTATYDSFSDALEGPTGYQRDSEAETGRHIRPGAGTHQGWAAETHTYFSRSSAFALRAWKSYVPQDLEKHRFNARFFDVELAIMLMEDWHPEHTFDRRQDLAYRREAIGWLDDHGLVLGTEHGNDWGLDLVEWTEGSIGGPFWWAVDKPGGWNAGHLKRANSRDDYPSAYVKYGLGHDTRVPFWQLAYHDCAVTTWYWGDGPGFHYHADPAEADRKDLFTLLYGGVPVLWRGPEGYDWTKNPGRFMRSVYDTCLFHEKVAFAEMTDHAFLSDDRALQRTAFSTGHTVTANFDTHPREVITPGGETVLLAPRGYWVEGPGFHQSLVWDQGVTVKRIETDGYRVHDARRTTDFGPVACDGQFVAFRVDDDRWQLALEAGRSFMLDPSGLTGWPADNSMTVAVLDRFGAVRSVLRHGTAGDLLEIAAEPAARTFALLRDPDPGIVFAHPEGPWATEGEPLVLSAAVPGVTVRYTLDGSEPGPGSPAADGPHALDRSVRVRARAFRGDESLGETLGRELKTLRPLFASGLVRGGDPALRVDVTLEGCVELRIFVGDGGDYPWNDWADLGDAAFVMADSSRVWLSDIEPLWTRHMYVGLGRDKHPTDGGGLAIAGVTFEKGIACQSQSDIGYAVPEGAVRFEAMAGVDDRANPAKGRPESLRGTVTFTVEGVLKGL